MLGSSDYGAQLGAELGLPYAFAYFFTDGVGAEQALQLYRHLYKPSERHPKAHPTMCVWALIADSEEEAWTHRHRVLACRASANGSTQKISSGGHSGTSQQ